MYDSQLELINEITTVDSYGDMTITTTVHTCFCDVRSIGTKEFYQAQGVGALPEMKFVLPDYLEYNGEPKVRFQNFGETDAKVYNVTRTYRNNNELEITVSKGIEN